MSETHFVGKVTLKALVVREGKVLLTREMGDVDIWELPGGRLNEGEGIEPGLARELREELGVRVRVGHLVYAEQFRQTRDGALTLLLAYEVTLEDPRAAFVLAPGEIAETKWIGRDELRAQRIYDNCLHALEAYWNT